jgi:hypothetical protein
MKNHWYESYWIVDMHGVITRPNHEIRHPKINFFPYAKETLQLITKREDIRLILYTSSYPDQVEDYIRQLKECEIEFNYINENPEIRSFEDFGYYEDKPYFDIYLDDKAGFDAENDWKDLYEFLLSVQTPDVSWKNPKRRRIKNNTDKSKKQTTNISEQCIGTF